MPMLCPYFYVGLGGFGCSVIRQLKKTVQEELSDFKDAFSFLGIDTHPHNIDDILTENEYVAVDGGIVPHEVARDNSEFLGWYNELAKYYRARAIQAGADQVRAVGRLAMRYPLFFAQIASKINNAIENLQTFREYIPRETPPKVIIISTVAGGTGSGMLIDVAAIIHHKFKERWGADFPFQAILLMPEVLTGEVPRVQEPRLWANAYATLKELHHFYYKSHGLTISYDNRDFNRVEISNTSLFDVIYIISHINEGDRSIASKIEEMAEIVKEFLLCDIKAPFQIDTPRILDKENSLINTPGVDGMPRVFSSFGMIRVGFPANVISDFFGLRLIRELLQKETETPYYNEEAESWLDENRLREKGIDQLQEQLNKGSDGNPFTVNFDAVGTIINQWQSSRQNIETICKNFYYDIKKEINEIYIGSPAKKNICVYVNKSSILEKIFGNLDEKTKNLRENKGIGSILSFLSSLESAIKTHEEDLLRDINALKSEFEKVEKNEIPSIIQVVMEASRKFLFRKKKTQDALSLFDGSIKKALNIYLKLRIMEIGDEIYRELLAEVRKRKEDLIKKMEEIKGRLNFVEEKEKNKRRELDSLADLERRGERNYFSLINATQANELFKEKIERDLIPVLQRIREKLIDKGLLQYTGLSDQDWLRSVSPDIVREEVMPRIEDMNIINVINKYFPIEANKRLIFKHITDLSLPLFPLNTQKKEPEYHDFWIIGINETLRNSFDTDFRKYFPSGGGFIYSSYDSPFEILIYQVKHGYTISSYKYIETYKSRYDRLQQEYKKALESRRGIAPVHAWPEGEDWEELVRDKEEEETVKLFALAIAFGRIFPAPSEPEDSPSRFIYKKGNFYYLTMPDRRQIRLGQGLENAVQKFGENTEWMNSIKERIDRKVQEVGNQEVQTKLNNFLQDLQEELQRAEPGSERERILRLMKNKLVEFIEELRPI